MSTVDLSNICVRDLVLRYIQPEQFDYDYLITLSPANVKSHLVLKMKYDMVGKAIAAELGISFTNLTDLASVLTNKFVAEVRHEMRAPAPAPAPASSAPASSAPAPAPAPASSAPAPASSAPKTASYMVMLTTTHGFIVSKLLQHLSDQNLVSKIMEQSPTFRVHAMGDDAREYVDFVESYKRYVGML